MKPRNIKDDPNHVARSANLASLFEGMTQEKAEELDVTVMLAAYAYVEKVDTHFFSEDRPQDERGIMAFHLARSVSVLLEYYAEQMIGVDSRCNCPACRARNGDDKGMPDIKSILEQILNPTTKH